ncbi:MAG: LamG-like jellyroll fold domain-containing protein, partial [Muribaculaceae bacterium]
GINWAQTRTDEGNGFWIGHSYNRDRWLEGNICEVRVWNRVLTKDEINSKDHFYEVNPQSDGLVSYWRFNEGAGTSILDHTGNGNNATAVEAITWNAVELPAKN